MDYKCIDFPMMDNIFSIYGIKIGSVGMKIFLFYFLMAIKITGSAQKYRVGRVSGNTAIFLFGLMLVKLFFAVSRALPTFQKDSQMLLAANIGYLYPHIVH